MPSREQLIDHAMRQLAGAALVVLAAVLTHQSQYAVIAVALLPQLLVDLLALRDHDRRRALRVTKRPVLILMIAGAALAASAAASYATESALPTVFAALIAAGGLVVAGSPTSITFAARTAR